MEKLLEAVFSMWFTPRLHKEWIVCCDLVGRRQNVCAKGNASRGSSKLCPVPNIV
jgi:hypothetical protein